MTPFHPSDTQELMCPAVGDLSMPRITVEEANAEVRAMITESRDYWGDQSLETADVAVDRVA